jgi:hypothetical protein
MASGHANRANRPNTWLYRPIPANAKILLANRSRRSALDSITLIARGLGYSVLVSGLRPR